MTIQDSEKRFLTPGTEVIASVVHASNYFAVLEFVNVSKDMVNIVDGLSLDLERWLDHVAVVNIFVQCKLLTSL